MGAMNSKGQWQQLLTMLKCIRMGLLQLSLNPQGIKYFFRLPGIKICGLIFSERSTHFFGAIKIEDTNR